MDNMIDKLEILRGDEMSYFDYKGKKIFYEDIGNGQPLLLLHGNTASSKMFEPIIPMLETNNRVITLDFLGCGQSERIEKWPEDLWYQWSEEAVALCDYLKVKDINIIGCSGGALAAINMVLSHDDMVHAVVADSFEGIKADKSLTEQIRIGRSYAKQNKGFCYMLQTMHGADWEAVLDADTKAVVSHAEHIEYFFHHPLSDLNRKMLLTGSAEDEMFPKGHYEKLFGMICSETQYASKHIFEHGGHPAMMSNAKEFIPLCEAFFASN